MIEPGKRLQIQVCAFVGEFISEVVIGAEGGGGEGEGMQGKERNELSNSPILNLCVCVGVRVCV